ncbi:hypothetical protein ACVWXU_000266 [Streptomyces sp. TE33382]
MRRKRTWTRVRTSGAFLSFPEARRTGGGVLRERTIRSTAGVDRPRSVIAHSSNENHSVGRAKASVPIRTRRAVPSLSRRMRWTYQRRISVSWSTGTDIPSTGSWPSSSHSGAAAWSRCTRSPPCWNRMSTTEPIAAPSGRAKSKSARSSRSRSQAAAADFTYRWSALFTPRARRPHRCGSPSGPGWCAKWQTRCID